MSRTPSKLEADKEKGGPQGPPFFLLLYGWVPASQDTHTELVGSAELVVRACYSLLPTLQVVDLVLDKNTHEVKRGGTLIELTPKEFALLAYLMRHSERVLSRTMIEEQVWGYQHDPLTNVVDVYIRRLRRKIDHGFQQPLIHTVRGTGYTLKA